MNTQKSNAAKETIICNCGNFNLPCCDRRRLGRDRRRRLEVREPTAGWSWRSMFDDEASGESE